MDGNRTRTKDIDECYNAHIEELVNSDEKDPNDMSKYYDWNKTLSFDADVTMVVGARGVGKTYGLRKQVPRDYIKRGWRFVEVCRFKSEVSAVASGYFSRIEANQEFPGYMFKTTPQRAYMAKVPEDDDYDVDFSSDGKTKITKKKIHWECIGYFIALSDAQALKKRTFHNVRRIIFDEAILDRRDKYHRYLPNEFMLIANIVDTVSRERADDLSLAPRVYLLGNALDLFNPYFEHYGITEKPERGYSWHKNKTMLLDYVESSEYSAEKLVGTVAGRMIAGTVEGAIEANNEFLQLGLDFIKAKSAKAEYQFAIYYSHNTFAIWCDKSEGLYYVCRKIPKSTQRPTFTLTASDARLNYIMAKRADKPMQMLADAFYIGILRFDNAATMNGFLEIMQLFGVKR